MHLLVAKLDPQFTEGQIAAALDWLSSEGLIYSTVGDGHWAAIAAD